MNPNKSLIILILAFCMVITACSAVLPSYNSKKAIENGDVVSVHGQVTNLSKLDNFVTKVNNAEKDKITVTTYTIEGDPIICTLNYNGKNIEYKVDTRRDKYGDRATRKYEFASIAKETDKNKTVYYVYNNDKTVKMDVLMVPEMSKN